MNTEQIRDRARQLIKQMFGASAEFRPGQLEAIEHILNQSGRLLIVQKTGWGKSVVYFIMTKINRELGKGPTLIISPLLALMRNQIYNANKLGLRAATINSSNTKEWEQVQNGLKNNLYDLLLISPERLSSQNFLPEIVPAIGRIGAFVVDEVHCISDWGHDFRPDYRRIKSIVSNVFTGIPIVGTTATANNRVVKDLEDQLGSGFTIMRGKLNRSGLKLQNIVLPTIAERLAWLADTIPKLKGSGIVYCLTRGDVFRVSNWLKQCGIDCHHYWGGDVLDDNKQDLSPILEQKLLDNKIKVLVATSALGMGYDKPDLNFVIHYQAPGSAIAYYQQVGRAGREVPESYGVLLHGSEEDEILDYFMREAFPTEDEERAVLGFLNTITSATQGQICRKLNMRSSRLEKALKHLLIDGYIEKSKSDYSRTVKAWAYDQQRKDQVQATRIRERERMKTYISHDGCLMRFIANELDDPTTQDCGICVNCRQGLLPTKPSQDTVQKALEFLHQDYVIIDPRKRWPNGLELSVNLQSKPTIVIPKGEVIEQGRALGYLENAGWGSVIRRCIKDNTTVPEDVINAAFYLLTKQWAPSPFPEWITYIPSARRSKVIVDFAKRLGGKLRIPVLDVIAISNTSKMPIYKYENSQQQVENSINNWTVKSPIRQSPVLLIDDFVNSRWTLTIVGRMLRINGTEKVYPFTLGSVKDTK